MSNSKRNKAEMAPSFQKNRKSQETKSETVKPGDKAQPTAEQMRIANIIETNKHAEPDIKDKVKQVMEATHKPDDVVISALHDCGYDCDQAVTLIIDGGYCTNWSTSTKKKKKPSEKGRDGSASNTGGKCSNSAPLGESQDDWNEEEGIGEDNGAAKSGFKGKPTVRPSRPQNRPWVKRGGVARANGKDFRPQDGNAEWRGGYKPSRGRTVYKGGRSNSQKEDGDNKDLSERLGQVEGQEKGHESDWDESDGSDHQKTNTEHDDASKADMANKSQADNVGNKWQSDDQYWKNSRGGRGSGPRGRGGYNSYANKMYGEEGDSRPGYQGKPNMGGRGRGRYQGSRGRGDGRPRQWDDGGGDRGGYRGRMSNGPNNRSWRGSRGRGRGSRPSIDTWNPHSSQPKEVNDAAEDWDQEEETYTGSLETKVFTPSSSAEVSKHAQEGVKEEVGHQLINQTEAPTLSASGQQFLAQLTSASKQHPQSVFNDHFSKTEIPPTEYGGGFSMSTFPEAESPSINDDLSRVKPVRPRLPPPSKIPSSAVEMPPDVGSGITLLDVQFGAMELTDAMDTVQQPSTQGSPAPSNDNIPQGPIMSSTEPLMLNEAQNYTSVRSTGPSNPISQLPELLSKSEPPSSYYQESIYQSNQYPKSTHQSYNSSYITQPSTYSSHSIYGSTGLGSNSLSNQYQTYTSSPVPRHSSAVTSTTNSKEFDVPTPSVNISNINPSSGTTVTPSSILSSAQGNSAKSTSNSSMSKMMTVPPGVPTAPIVNAQYIMNQTGVPYFQQPLYSLEDFQLLQQQRIPSGHVAGYYDMGYQNQNRDGVQYNITDTRFAQGDTNTSPVQATSLSAQTGSQNHQQPMMNPAIPPPYAYAFYGGSMIPPNYQYSTPIYPIAASGTNSGHGNTNSPYPKTATNYTGNYTANYEGSQTAGDYKSSSAQVSKVPQYQVTNATTTAGLSNMYPKTYEKHSFNCGTPPPYTLGSQSSAALGPSYAGAQAQQLFYSAVTPHHTMHQPLHQDSSSPANRSSQLAPQASKVTNKVTKYPTSGYWSQN